MSSANLASSHPSTTRSPVPHASPPAFRVPRPPGTDVPATREVPAFAPVCAGGGRYAARQLTRSRRRAVAAGLAVTAAALVAAGPRAMSGPRDTGAERPRGRPAAEPLRRHGPAAMVRAPVRIADAASVRLLRPGDRVDVIAAEERPTGGGAQVLARGARVTRLPEPLGDTGDGVRGDPVGGGGALVVLAVPRATAARLVGANPSARLAVTLW
ncbi:hypothetical protein [Streptomyces sp. NPDC005435]|uniref:hypothetical protein n=1 Tax=Streptomyces sp. NPDC005435 TaxID=3154464 RepID=UPI0034558E3D